MRGKWKIGKRGAKTAHDGKCRTALAFSENEVCV